MIKQRIIEEASVLFARSGVKSTTMDDIARHMGISKRTIYENFKDKETLLVACIGAFYRENRIFSERVFEKSENVIVAVTTLLKKGAEQAQQQQFVMINDIRKYYPQVYKEHLVIHHANKYQEMASLIERGITEGVFRDDLNPEIIAHIFNKQAEGMTSAEKELDKFSFSEIFENMVINFMRGLCTQKGVEILNDLMRRIHNK